MNPVIAVDLDGTLAKIYWPEDGPYDHRKIGDPIPAMVKRVKQWLSLGVAVKIFTARVGVPLYGNNHPFDLVAVQESRDAINAWCLTHIGRILDVTAIKDYTMVEFWDDRAVQVIPNTGLRADRKA